MKDEVNDRILKLINSKKMTSQKFASMLNVQSSNISHITSKRNKPSFDLLFNILSVFPEVSSDWLLMGIGDMYRGESEVVKEDILSNVPLKSAIEIVEGDLFEEKPTKVYNSEPIQPITTTSTFTIANNDQETTLFDDFYNNGSEYPINDYDTTKLNALFNNNEPTYLSVKEMPQKIHNNDIKEYAYNALPVQEIVENSVDKPCLEAIIEPENLDGKQLNDLPNKGNNDNQFIHTEALNEIVTQDIVVKNPISKTDEGSIKDNTIINKQVCDEPIKEVISSNSNTDNAESISHEKEQPQSQAEPQQQIHVTGVEKSKKVDKILLLFDDNTYQEFFGK